MPSAERSVSERFGLSWDGQMQDWAIENANAELLPVFLCALTQASLSEDEMYSLMELSIASADEALRLDMNNRNNCISLKAALRKRPCLYASAIFYWAAPALMGLPDEEQFLISRHMATLWNELLPELVSSLEC
jgi:hypothetical protein